MIIQSRGQRVPLTCDRHVGEARSMPTAGLTLDMSRASTAAMVPAVAAAVRLVSDTVASFVMRVYRGDSASRRPELDASQSMLLQEPMPGESSFVMWEDLVTSVELFGGGFVWKHRGRNGQVVGLQVLDPSTVTARRLPDGSTRVTGFVDGRPVDLTGDVIHVRGWSPVPAATDGVGTTELHTRTVRAAADLDEFRSRYLANDATPSLVLTHPGNPTVQQRTDLLRAWVRRHQGPDGRTLPGMVWGGMDVKQLQTSMRDAQGAELSDVVVREVARMFRIFPPELLHVTVGSSSVSSTESAADMFMRFSLTGRLRRLERAFAADRDLFPDSNLYPRFDTAEFTRGDTATVAAKLHQLVQVGAVTANEARAELGLPPHADGDRLQVTPVGGAPNTQPAD